MSRYDFAIAPVAAALLALATSASAAPLRAAQQAGPPDVPQTTERPAIRSVEPPASFRRAVEADTRTPEGRPGPEYWQQRVDYDIEAELDPATGRIEGRQTIAYRNRSPDTLRSVVLHLDQNVYAEGARRNRRAPITGGMEVRDLRVDGETVRTRRPGSSYYEALTLLEVVLPEPLPPGDSTRLSMEWGFTVPPAPTFRNGNVDGELFGVAQWYPRTAVYDDVDGWNRSPYLGDGEFYLEYGDFEVDVTVPSGWIVAATGTLENPDEVLSEPVARRLEGARASDEVVRVVPPDEAGSDGVTRDADRLTWRFRAEDVRDFAFTASADYVWEAKGVALPREDGDGAGDDGADGTDAETAPGPDRVLVQAFYRPDLDAWSRTVEFTEHGLRTFSRWLGRYPYPQLSVAEGPTGGMEYPMMVFNPSRNRTRGLAAVTLHEVAHQWVPMAVGTMEAKHVWMDEGVVSYWDALSMAELFDEAPPRWGENRSYLQAAGDEREVPITRHTDLVSPYGLRGLAAYTKPAVVLGALREVVGDEAFRRAFREFFREWRFRHPRPWDFFHTVERVHGEDLDWFWRPLFFETTVLDHAVESVRYDDGQSVVRLEDLGGVILPTPVRFTMEDGNEIDARVPPEAWLRGPTHELRVPGRVVEVRLDPERLFPDVDRGNGTWRESDR